MWLKLVIKEIMCNFRRFIDIFNFGLVSSNNITVDINGNCIIYPVWVFHLSPVAGNLINH